MGLTVRCILFLQLFNIGEHLSTASVTTSMTQRIDQLGGSHCSLQFTTIGSTFNGTGGSCKYLDLESVNFTEPSQRLFDSLANGLIGLSLLGCNINIIYLPQNLSKFQFYADTSGCATKIIVDENATYKLEHLSLAALPQLPGNVNRLRSLKSFHLNNAHEANIDLTILSELTQLQEIIMSKVASVTIPQLFQLPALHILSIYESPITLANDTSLQFPDLDVLILESNNLRAIPVQFCNLTTLTRLSIVGNNLGRVHLDVFAEMKQIKSLALQQNEITEIIAENEVQFPRLTVFTLYNNKLTELNVTLWRMPALEYLSLSGNQLKRVPGVLTLLSAQPAIQTFLMDHNQLDCDWMDVTVRRIPGVQVLIADNDGLCRTYGWISRPLNSSKTDLVR